LESSIIINYRSRFIFTFIDNYQEAGFYIYMATVTSRNYAHKLVNELFDCLWTWVLLFHNVTALADCQKLQKEGVNPHASTNEALTPLINNSDFCEDGFMNV